MKFFRNFGFFVNFFGGNFLISLPILWGLIPTPDALPLCLAWRTIVLQAPLHFVILAKMVTRCFMKVVGIVVVSVLGHLLPLSFHTDWNRKWNSLTCKIVCVLLRTAKHNLQVVHFFQIVW